MTSEPLKSPLPGKIISVNVKVGDRVKRGDLLLVIESMKMENEIYSPTDGTIVDVKIFPGDPVNIDDILLVIDESSKAISFR